MIDVCVYVDLTAISEDAVAISVPGSMGAQSKIKSDAAELWDLHQGDD
jgi:hypothetical protein